MEATGTPHTVTTNGWVLWSGTVGFDTPVLDRIPAAAAGGYDHLSLSPIDVLDGPSPTEIARRAADAGLALIMDPVMGWHPTERPFKSDFARVPTVDTLRFCEQLGVATMSAVAANSTALDDDGLAEAFAGLCDQAAELGALVHIEFIPMTVVPDLATAWRIVEIADRPNGGLLFDTWHWFRGNPDFDLLATVPGDKVLAVQVDDAAAEIQGSLWEDTMHRLLPGDGSFDLHRALAALHAIGGLRRVGPEVISPEMAAMDTTEAAILAGQRVRDVLATAALDGTEDADEAR